MARETRQLVLSLDIGSSSVRGGLFDTVGNALPRTFYKVSHSFVSTPDGGSEMDADECFERVVAVIDEVMAKAERMQAEVIAVALCSFWHSLMGVDDRGKPTTPVLGWADTRSGRHSSLLKKRFDERSVHDRTGAHFHSSFWPAKLLWLKTDFPNIFNRTAMWISFADLLLSRLIDPEAMPVVQFGEWLEGGGHMTGFREAYTADPLPILTSISMASATGLFDNRNREWDAPSIGPLGLSSGNLPQIVPRKDHTFKLRRKYQRRWPKLKSAEIFPAIGDGAADHVGSCGLGKTNASLMVGTSAAMRVAYTGETPAAIPDGLWCYRVDSTRVIVGGALSDGGNLVDLLRSTLNVPKNAEAQMRQRGAAAHGLTMMPFVHGERSTGYREDARGEILGLTASHDSVDILQAAMESTAYRLAAVNDRLKAVDSIKHIVASGGALNRSTVWPQIIADVLGRDLLVNDTSESAMRGAVLLALESLGKIESIDSFSPPAASTLAFHPECHAAYKRARKRHEEFYKQTAKPT